MAAASTGKESWKSRAHGIATLLAVQRANGKSQNSRPTSAHSIHNSKSDSGQPPTATSAAIRSSAYSTPSKFSEVVSEDFLSCKICFKGLIRPRLLRCLHTFCEDCLIDRISQVNPLKATIECAVCHTITRVMGNGVGELFVHCLAD